MIDRAEFLAAVYAYLGRTGGSVTSWRRTEDHNRKVGGVPDSPHLQGLAVDVVYDLPAVDATSRGDLARQLGLALIIEHDHDHLQPADWKAGVA